MTIPILLAAAGASSWFDQDVVGFFNRPIRSGQLQNALRNLRCWGEGSTIVILILGWLFASRRHWRVPAAMAIVGLSAGILVELVKPLTGRPRPAYAMNPQTGAHGDRNSSFPSGHTATAFAVAQVWSAAMPAARPAFLLAACGTGVSRMYEQRHYLSDCAVGAILGWYLSVAWTWLLTRWWGRKGFVDVLRCP